MLTFVMFAESFLVSQFLEICFWGETGGVCEGEEGLRERD